MEYLNPIEQAMAFLSQVFLYLKGTVVIRNAYTVEGISYGISLLDILTASFLIKVAVKVIKMFTEVKN